MLDRSASAGADAGSTASRNHQQRATTTTGASGRVSNFRGELIQQVDAKARTAMLEMASNKDFRWHDLRHTFATWHRQAGTPTHGLERLGGWKAGAMVERYAHVAPEAL
jgi:integrase